MTSTKEQKVQKEAVMPLLPNWHISLKLRRSHGVTITYMQGANRQTRYNGVHQEIGHR